MSFKFLMPCLLLALIFHASARQIVSLNSKGELVYQKDPQGNRIPDFSRAGYGGGGVSFPEVKSVKALSPSTDGGDDTKRIQKAIDDLARLPADRNGFRGAVLLRRGTFRVNGTLRLKRSGVVLRGQGQFEDGTIIYATGKRRRPVIEVGKNRFKPEKIKGSTRKIQKKKYLPWGSHELPLESVEGLKVGDDIVIRTPGTKAWIRANGMDRIAPNNPREQTRQWLPWNYAFQFERTIEAIDGKTVRLDAPLVNAIESRFGGGEIYRFLNEGRTEKIGIEGLRIVSEYEKGRLDQDEKHAHTGIIVKAAEDVWIRNVNLLHLSWGVSLIDNAKFVTVQDCAFLEPSFTDTGGRRYAFYTSGQYCLFQRCYTDKARHSQVTGGRTMGPNVFLDCFNERTLCDTGPHHRWAATTLWDNLKGGEFNAEDRGSRGTGHGWAGSVQVFWNCQASEICVQKPPTGQNYAIGCIGQIVPGIVPGRRLGHFESHGKPLRIRSLYLAQLEQRLGKEAVRRIAIPQQLEGTIYSLLKGRLGR